MMSYYAKLPSRRSCLILIVGIRFLLNYPDIMGLGNVCKLNAKRLQCISKVGSPTGQSENMSFNK